MNIIRKIFWNSHYLKSIFVGLLLIILAAIPCMSSAGTISEEEAFAIGTEAYIYGYPLVTMEMTRRVMTNVVKPEGTRAPMGQLVRMREYPPAAFRDVTAPNADTLYTVAWLDVGKETWVLSLPDAHGRYYLFPMLDGWTDVFQVPGKRTTGTGPQKYAITGPGWTGKLPPRASQNTNRPPAWFGSWAASIALVRRKTTRPYMPCRTRSPWFHSAPMEIHTPILLERWPPALT